MKRAKRILFGIGCMAVLLVSWVVVITAKSDSEKQAELIAQAGVYISDDIYVPAVPLLEEAAGYTALHTAEAETALKQVYLELIDQRGYRRKYIGLLEKQMGRKDASPGAFSEAAQYYLSISKLSEALTVLKDGIVKTSDEGLIALYEQNRYFYTTSRTAYEDVTAISNDMIAVQLAGFWGLAKSDGTLLVPCEYEKVSTYANGRSIVKKDGSIYAVDSANNRLSLLKSAAYDFGNYADNRIPILTNEGWKRATGEFVIGSTAFEEIGMYGGGYSAAKQSGKWGVVDLAVEWLVPADYDTIAMDELGRCYGQNAVFAGKGNQMHLIVGGEQTGAAYEDAKPFSSEGYAAVKKNGKWGFVNTAGELVIDYHFDEALSFGQHLAAVRQGDLWGYVSLTGQMVIEPVFYQAKSFSGGIAPVRTERGWQFITLTEYRKGASL